MGLIYDELQGLIGRLNPPPGWAYRAKVLDRHLTLRSVEGRTCIVQDELENSYAP